MDGIVFGIDIPSVERLLVQQRVLGVTRIETRIHPSSLCKSWFVFVHGHVHIICVPIVLSTAPHEDMVGIEPSVKRMVRTSRLTQGSNAAVQVRDSIDHMGGHICIGVYHRTVDRIEI